MPGPASPKIVVTGATSIIGYFLLPRLVNAGYEVHAISRNRREKPGETDKKVFWHPVDISHPDLRVRHARARKFQSTASQ